MVTSVKNRTVLFRIAALLSVAFCICSGASFGKELPIPDQPPAPPELAGRWMEKTAAQKGGYTRYCLYVFTRKSEFHAFYAAYDTKAKKWTDATKIFKGGPVDWSGYVQSDGPDSLVLNAMLRALFPVVLPVKVKYHLAGDTLTLLPSLGAPGAKTPVTLQRVERFPDALEGKSDQAILDQKIADGLFGEDFRQWFRMGLREASDHPTDDAMIRNFHEHQEDFEKLLAMVREDKEVKDFHYDADATQHKAPDGLSPERFEQYRALFEKLDLQGGVSGFGDSQKTCFTASTRGMLNSGSSKSYWWLSEPPPQEQIVESIDDYVEKDRARQRAYFDKNGHGAPNKYFTIHRHIEGNWWLQYEH